MRLILIFTSLLFTIVGNATDRAFICNGVDSLDRQSIFELNVDTGVIRMKETSPIAHWKIIYSDKISCTHKVPTSYTCTRQLKHNFDNPNKTHAAATDRIRCIRGNGKPVMELNGGLEINRFGDGTGSFVCGPLTRYSLMLENCQVRD